MLTDGIWNFQNLTTDSQDEAIQKLAALGKAVLVDGTLEFKEGGEYLITSPLLNEPETGTWSLAGEDQLIMTPDGGVPSTANIDVLSKKELTYINTMVDANMQSYNLTTTWVR